MPLQSHIGPSKQMDPQILLLQAYTTQHGVVSKTSPKIHTSLITHGPRRITRQSLRPTVSGGLFAQTLWAVLIVTLTHCMLHIKPPSHAQRQKAVSKPMHNACHACSWQLHSWQRMKAGVHRSTLHAWLVPMQWPWCWAAVNSRCASTSGIFIQQIMPQHKQYVSRSGQQNRHKIQCKHSTNMRVDWADDKTQTPSHTKHARALPVLSAMCAAFRQHTCRVRCQTAGRGSLNA